MLLGIQTSSAAQQHHVMSLTLMQFLAVLMQDLGAVILHKTSFFRLNVANSCRLPCSLAQINRRQKASVASKRGRRVQSAYSRCSAVVVLSTGSLRLRFESTR